MVIFVFPGKTLIIFLKLPSLSNSTGIEFIKTVAFGSVLPITVIFCDETTEFSAGAETLSKGLKIADLY